MAISNYRARLIDAAQVLFDVLNVYGETHLCECVLSNIDDWRKPGSFLAKSNLVYAAAIAMRLLSDDLVAVLNRSEELDASDGYLNGLSIRKSMDKIMLYFL